MRSSLPIVVVILGAGVGKDVADAMGVLVLGVGGLTALRLPATGRAGEPRQPGGGRRKLRSRGPRYVRGCISPNSIHVGGNVGLHVVDHAGAHAHDEVLVVHVLGRKVLQEEVEQGTVQDVVHHVVRRGGVRQVLPDVVVVARKVMMMLAPVVTTRVIKNSVKWR